MIRGLSSFLQVEPVSVWIKSIHVQFREQRDQHCFESAFVVRWDSLMYYLVIWPKQQKIKFLNKFLSMSFCTTCIAGEKTILTKYFSKKNKNLQIDGHMVEAGDYFLVQSIQKSRLKLPACLPKPSRKESVLKISCVLWGVVQGWPCLFLPLNQHAHTGAGGHPAYQCEPDGH